MSIEKDIEKTAEKMAKSTNSVEDRIKETVRNLSAEQLKAVLPTLSKSQTIILKDVLESMKLEKGAKSPSMDKDYEVGYHKGDVYKDTKIQEDKADDDADEKLVKPENAKHKHQGDEAPERREGQVVKSEIDIAKDSEETADEAVSKVKKTEKEKHEKKMCKGSELVELAKSDDMVLKTMVHKMCEMGKDKKFIMDKCMSKGLDGKKIEAMIDAKMSEHNDKMHKGEKLDGYDKDELLKEEDQNGSTKHATEGESRANKEKSGEDDVVSANGSAQKKVDNMKQGMKKSAEWTEGTQSLLKANTLGRNFHFSVNDYLEKSAKEDIVEEVKKSEQKEDINDIIEKSLDCGKDEIIAKSIIASNKEKLKGKIVKSFSDNEIAAALGLTEEQAKELLGE